MTAAPAFDAFAPVRRNIRFRPYSFVDEDKRLRLVCKGSKDELRLTEGFLRACETHAVRLLKTGLTIGQMQSLFRGPNGPDACVKTIQRYVKRLVRAGIASMSSHWRVTDRVITFVTLGDRCAEAGLDLDDARHARQERHNARRRLRRAELRAERAQKSDQFGHACPNSKSQNASDSPADEENGTNAKVGALIQTLKAQSKTDAKPGPTGHGGVPHVVEDGGQRHGPNTLSPVSDASPFPVPAGSPMTQDQFKSINAAYGLKLKWRYIRWLKAPPGVLIDAVFFAKRADETRQDGDDPFYSLERIIFNSTKQRMRGHWGPWKGWSES